MFAPQALLLRLCSPTVLCSRIAGAPQWSSLSDEPNHLPTGDTIKQDTTYTFRKLNKYTRLRKFVRYRKHEDIPCLTGNTGTSSGLGLAGSGLPRESQGSPCPRWPVHGASPHARLLGSISLVPAALLPGSWRTHEAGCHAGMWRRTLKSTLRTGLLQGLRLVPSRKPQPADSSMAWRVLMGKGWQVGGGDQEDLNHGWARWHMSAIPAFQRLGKRVTSWRPAWET